MERVRVATASELREGTQKYVNAHGKQLYVSNVGGEFFTAECNCPCPLSGGVLNRIVDVKGAPCVECDARCYTLAFDLRTGKNTRGEDLIIEVFPTKIESDTVFAEMEPTAPFNSNPESRPPSLAEGEREADASPEHHSQRCAKAGMSHHPASYGVIDQGGSKL